MVGHILLQYLAALLTIGDVKTQQPAVAAGGGYRLQRLLRPARSR